MIKQISKIPWDRLFINDSRYPCRLLYLHPFEVAFFTDLSTDELTDYFSKILKILSKQKRIRDTYYDFSHSNDLLKQNTSVRLREYFPRTNEFYFDIVTVFWNDNNKHLQSILKDYAETTKTIPLREHFVIAQNFQKSHFSPKIKTLENFSELQLSEKVTIRKERTSFELRQWQFSDNETKMPRLIFKNSAEKTQCFEIVDVGLRILIDEFGEDICNGFRHIIEIEFDLSHMDEALKIFDSAIKPLQNHVMPKHFNKIVYKQ